MSIPWHKEDNKYENCITTTSQAKLTKQGPQGCSTNGRNWKKFNRIGQFHGKISRVISSILLSVSAGGSLLPYIKSCVKPHLKDYCVQMVLLMQELQREDLVIDCQKKDGTATFASYKTCDLLIYAS